VKVLVIDNYDSFTYNLVQYLQELDADVIVYRNDVLSLDKIKELEFERAVISPGPGRPADAGVSCDFIREFYDKLPILGVCLGHQCMGEVFGGRIVKAEKIMHGKTSLIYHNGKDLFKTLENPFSATRYHSLVIEKKTCPKSLTITAHTKDGIIMGVKMNNFPLYGVQFHPESILTGQGKKLMANFLKI
jgi:anthranilate synthase component II